MRLAVIVLNRNLPDVTDKLCENLLSGGLKPGSLFVIEAGSDDGKVSRFCTWHIRDEETKKNGLRYNRGMNQALINLYQERKWENFDGFLFLTNDTEFTSDSPTSKLENIFDDHKHIGILVPCSQQWGEKHYIPSQSEKYFWNISSSAIAVRKSFVEEICNKSDLSCLNFFFDGNNFRGYLTDMELVAKAYINGWGVAITTRVFAEENNIYLLTIADIIKTESYDRNLELYVQEGLDWARKKYGFQSKWDFVRYTKLYYDEFFKLNPGLTEFKI